jgi:signal transduction histidine kinase
MSAGQRVFAEEPGAPARPPWPVLIVDDAPDIHAVTRLSLRSFTFEGRGVEWLSAHSAAEARALLAQRHDIALVLLDVVMETDRAGLDLARAIREEMHNPIVRIVLRTGQAGEAPPLAVIDQYEIDDFCNKMEMTFERMTIVVKTALRTHKLLKELADERRALLESNDDLQRFNYVASHDMKTPLRSIVSSAQLLEKRYGEIVEPKDRELLRFVARGASDLHALVESLLELSRLGRTAMDAQMVDLNAIVRRALEHLRGVIEERGARVECAGLPTLPGQPTLLEQLFRNLIENGLKFQPGAEPGVRIAAVSSNEHWEIRVSDRGIGMEARHLSRIFEPFQRLHGPGEYPGSGIGLAICSRVAQLHGGGIRALSSPGNGTTMVVTLPKVAPRR